MWTLILPIEPSCAHHVCNNYNLLLVIVHPNWALSNSIHTAYYISHPTLFRAYSATKLYFLFPKIMTNGVFWSEF